MPKKSEQELIAELHKAYEEFASKIDILKDEANEIIKAHLQDIDQEKMQEVLAKIKKDSI